MGKVSEGIFDIRGQSLYTRSWLPDGPTKAKLILVHGFSDHVNMYNDFGAALADAGIAVHGFDQRGWGRSVRKPSDKGLTGPTSQVVAEIAAFVATHLPDGDSHSNSVSPPPPVFVLGHSMGGGEIMALAGDPAHRAVVSRVRGWLLEAPFLGWAPGGQPSAFKIFAGRLVGRLLPRQQLVHRFAPEDLTRDPATVAVLREDKLCHDTGTLEGLAGLLDRTDALIKNQIRIDPTVVRSLWLGHGTADRATGYDHSSRWFDAQTALEDKTFRTYDGWFHQLHTEPAKEEYFGHVIEWVLARCGGAEQPATAAAAATGDTTKIAESAEAKSAAAEERPESKL